jgi:hypothetical protein
MIAFVVLQHGQFLATAKKCRHVHMILLDSKQIDPIQFALTKFDFTFLMNIMTIKTNWRAPALVISHPLDVLAKDGCYGYDFKEEWTLQWLKWQTNQPYIPFVGQVVKFSESKVRPAELIRRRKKFEHRGFLIFGSVPQETFCFESNAFADHQRQQGDQKSCILKRKRDDIGK